MRYLCMYTKSADLEISMPNFFPINEANHCRELNKNKYQRSNQKIMRKNTRKGSHNLTSLEDVEAAAEKKTISQTS